MSERRIPREIKAWLKANSMFMSLMLERVSRSEARGVPPEEVDVDDAINVGIDGEARAENELGEKVGS